MNDPWCISGQTRRQWACSHTIEGALQKILDRVIFHSSKRRRHFLVVFSKKNSKDSVFFTKAWNGSCYKTRKAFCKVPCRNHKKRKLAKLIGCWINSSVFRDSSCTIWRGFSYKTLLQNRRLSGPLLMTESWKYPAFCEAWATLITKDNSRLVLYSNFTSSVLFRRERFELWKREVGRVHFFRENGPNQRSCRRYFQCCKLKQNVFFPSRVLKIYKFNTTP